MSEGVSEGERGERMRVQARACELTRSSHIKPLPGLMLEIPTLSWRLGCRGIRGESEQFSARKNDELIAA